MDLTQARDASFALDLDLDDDEAVAERTLTGRTHTDYQPIYSDRGSPRIA
jgi:hypothetical protein